MRVIDANDVIIIENKQCFVKGYLFHKNHLYQNEELKELLVALNLEQIEELVKTSYGSYFFCIEYKGTHLVATDIICSVPIFGMKDISGEIIISEDYLALNKRGFKFNNNVVDELLATCYITGEETLVENIYKFQGGTLYLFEKEELKDKRRYYKVRTDISGSEDAMLGKMITAYRNAFERMREYLSGRQVVVPLSGGLDGRFITAYLKSIGYTNIVTFTYGLAEKSEVSSSKKIAQSLGVKWLFVPYESDKLKKLFYSEKYKDLCLSVSNLCAIPMIQDWYAMEYLKNNGLIEGDAVVIPGHAASNMAELSPESLDKKEFFSVEEIANIIYETNYIYWNVNKQKVQNKLKKNIIRWMAAESTTYDAIEAYNYVKDFCYLERQVKLIANASRIYSYLGYDYYMPFWDNEVAEAWNCVNKRYSDNRKIYYDVIENIFPGLTRIVEAYGHTAENNIVIKRTKLQQLCSTMLPRVYSALRSFKSQNDNMNLWGYLSCIDRCRGAIGGQKFADSMWTKYFIRIMIKEIKERK